MFCSASRILAALFILFAALPCFAQPLKVGVILPLSGEAAHTGEALKSGMELAISDLDAELSGKLKFVFEDDGNLPRNTISALTQLINQDKIDLLVTETAAPSMAVAPMAESRRLPMLSVAIPIKIVENKKYVMLHFPPYEKLLRLTVDEALQRGYKHIARINTVHDGRLLVKETFDQLSKGKIQIEPQEDYLPDARDFRSYLAKLKKTQQLDAIHVNLFLGQAGLFARQAREMGVTLPLFTTEMFEDLNEVAQARGALTGQWFVAQAGGTAEFQDKFRQRFPSQGLFKSLQTADFTMQN